MQGNAVSCSVRPRVREKTPTTDRENEKCDRVKMRCECQDCGGGIFQYVIKWLIGLNIGGRCMGGCSKNLGVWSPNRWKVGPPLGGWRLATKAGGKLAPKQVADGRLVPKTGGRWEIEIPATHPHFNVTKYLLHMRAIFQM